MNTTRARTQLHLVRVQLEDVMVGLNTQDMPVGDALRAAHDELSLAIGLLADRTSDQEDAR